MLHVFQSEMEYARARNSAADAIRAGERAVQLAPECIPALLTLAEVLPAGAAELNALDRSVHYARRALELIETRHVSQVLALDDCQQLQRQVRSRAHAALGLVAGKRGDLSEAITEFELAIAENPGSDSVQLFRLAKLYAASGRRERAATLFAQISEAGTPEIRTLANAERMKER